MHKTADRAASSHYVCDDVARSHCIYTHICVYMCICVYIYCVCVCVSVCKRPQAVPQVATMGWLQVVGPLKS